MLMIGGNPPKKNIVETDIEVRDLSLIVDNLKLIEMIMKSTLIEDLAVCLNGRIIHYHYKNKRLYKSVGKIKKCKYI